MRNLLISICLTIILSLTLGNSACAPRRENGVESPPLTTHREGEAVKLGKFTVQAGFEYTTIQFREKVGDERIYEKAGEGMIYALVPIGVKNDSDDTRSFSPGASWSLTTDDGEYPRKQKLEQYLDPDGRFDRKRIPAGESRFGYLAFEIPKEPGGCGLKLTTAGEAHQWVFAGDN